MHWLVLAMAASKMHDPPLGTAGTPAAKRTKWEVPTTPAAYEDMCFAVWSGGECHECASDLMQRISSAGGGVVDVEACAGEWVVSALCALGFSGPDAGQLCAAPELVSELVSRQNAARTRSHADAAAKRGEILDGAVRDASARQAGGRVQLLSARDSLRSFLASPSGAGPAAWPVLAGAARLLEAQAASSGAEVVWHCPRAALLNGGDDFVRDAVKLLCALALCPRASANAAASAAAEEGEGDAAGVVAWAVREGSLTEPELRALAAAVHRGLRAARAGHAPAVRLDTSQLRRYKPPTYSNALAWLRGLLVAWLCRLG